MVCKMFSEEKLSNTMQKQKQNKKTQQSIGIKSFYLNTSSGFEYKKTL